MIGHICAIAASVLIQSVGSRVVNRLKSIAPRMLFEGPGAGAKLPFKLAVIGLFYSWFLFFSLNFLSGTIKTEGSLIKTDDLIDSLPRLISTRRVWVRFFDIDEKLQNAPKRSFLAKLSKKNALVLGNRVGFKELEEQITRKGINSFFFFESQNSVLFSMAYLAPMAAAMDLVGFLNFGNYYETLNAFYIRKSLDAGRKRFVEQR